MKKSSYSLILTEDVVKMVDAVAHQRGTSRSALVDRILAEYVGLPTGQVRRQQIFDSAKTWIHKHSALRLMEQDSGSALVVLGHITYRYSPVVRYRVELVPGSSEMGMIQVQSRSQNKTLLSLMERFFESWQAVEEEVSGEGHACEIRYGSMSRPFALEQPEQISLQEFGKTLADYISLLNDSLNLFLQNPDQLDLILKNYQEFYKSHAVHL